MWFNTTEVETNVFVMADDVYNMMEIFNEAASFEGRMIKRIEHLLSICDVLVFVVLATIVGPYLVHNCFSKLQRRVKRSTSARIISPMKLIKEKKSVRGSNANFRETEEQKINSEWNLRSKNLARKPQKIRSDISESEMITRRDSDKNIDDDEITLKPTEGENYSAMLIGTREWAGCQLFGHRRTVRV
ncbi:uncharacterized protein LOC117899372 [Drosophila subobscura]|uniref:uncharacterized protein LOC117899372 n=1 Tax=Drosophila subobscura TaxID=7241 RepID=UPI00155AD44E|nr:uncharacterized protein LOC117899372 [Drosophila subobscura]